MTATTPPAAVALSNPHGLYDPSSHGYSHIALTAPGARIVFVAGQGGETEGGMLQPDFRLQVRQALSNPATALNYVGSALQHVAKLTVLVVNHDEEKLRIFGKEMDCVFRCGPKPTCTLIPVSRPALDGMLFVVEATAIMRP